MTSKSNGEEQSKPGAAAVSATPKQKSPGRTLDPVTIGLAALVGAAIALGVQLGLQVAGLWPGEAGTDLSSIERRVADLERAPTSTVADDVAELQRSLRQLRQDMNALEALPRNEVGGDAAFADAVARLETSLDGAEGRLAALEARTPTDLLVQLGHFADQASVAEIAARIAALEEDALTSDARRVATALALAQLAQVAQGSAAFGGVFEAVSRLRPDDEVLGQIAPYAETGVPTVAMLRAEFPAVARRAARAARSSEEITAWGRVQAWLGQAIFFRRTGDIDGTGTEAILARAELRVAESNLGAAAEEMNALTGEVRDTAAAWTEGAEARTALDQLIAALSVELIAELDR